MSVVTIRSSQKVFTEEEVAGLWIAAGTAAGLDLGRDILEKEVLDRFVPRLIERIAARASAEVVEKWAARMIPVASAAIGAGLNYWFVRAWGERARAHFRARHLEVRPERLALIAGNLPSKA